MPELNVNDLVRSSEKLRAEEHSHPNDLRQQ